MTLDEAILHAKQKADENKKSAHCKCAEEHRQLAEWLKDYKRLKEQESVLDKIRAEIDEQYDRVHPYNISCAEGLEMALEIIDKYKAESEE